MFFISKVVLLKLIVRQVLIQLTHTAMIAHTHTNGKMNAMRSASASDYSVTFSISKLFTLK